jgi:glucosamine-6-phosphate deaminase
VNIQIFDDVRALSAELATRVRAAVTAKPSLVLGLPTGRTPLPFYKALREGPVADWSQVRTFNLDEFVGVDASSPDSYRAYMQRELFGPVGVPAAHVEFLNGCALDLDLECERYEQAIAAAGGIDLMILGIGTNGHIGFNEPGPYLHARSHRAHLQPGTRQSNAAMFGGDVARVPEAALSMGMATILQARSVVLMATGAGKANVVEAMTGGHITTSLPASFLQLHPRATVMLDREAANRR